MKIDKEPIVTLVGLRILKREILQTHWGDILEDNHDK